MRAILEGRQPLDLTPSRLLRLAKDLPLSWADQHRLLADAAREFSAEHTPARLRACRARDPEFDRSIWTAIAQLGWLGLLVDEADGGLGATFEDMGQLVYAWGHACAPEPLVASAVLACRTLRSEEHTSELQSH